LCPPPTCPAGDKWRWPRQDLIGLIIADFALAAAG
jgi:hypothetical protein